MLSFLLENIIAYVFVGLIGFVLTGVLTVWNIYNCCSKEPKKEKLISSITVFEGGVLYFLLHGLEFEVAGDWYERIYEMQIHNSISSEYVWFIVFIILLGSAGFFILLFVNADKLSPLISV